ncbi:MAG TPA: segregation/condensation protein A [Spirochaetota bacterium]|nr:segregation/condensation protein A [Spirochaetota bacterium]HNT11607.1 segregation/condensation protein A [Spirochaetota bacterium]
MEQQTDRDSGGGRTDACILHVNDFSGPLDLLWDLIKRAKIDIAEISISRITEQYIAYLSLMEKNDIQVAAEFIVMASELLYYKSKSILPSDAIEDEYFVPPLPPDLIAKLLEFKKYQMASHELQSQFDQRADMFSRPTVPAEFDDVDATLIEVSLFDLLAAFADVMAETVETPEMEIVFDEILVSERIVHIQNLLGAREQVLFAELFSERPRRMEIVATFLAILELAKMHAVRLYQHAVFGDIHIVRGGWDPGVAAAGDGAEGSIADGE